jgi:two-component sensor histidine kinase
MTLPNSTEGDAGLLAFVQQLSRAKSLDEIMALASHGVRATLQADGASFVLREGDRCYYADEDAISPLWKGRRFPMNACISGWCMTNRQPVAVPDIYEDDRIPTDVYRPTFVRSLAMVPVGADDEPLAALGAYWSEKRQPLPEELARLQTIADAVAHAAANLQPRSDRVPPDRRLTADRFTLGSYVLRFRREGQPSAEAYGLAVLCVVVATLLRLAIKGTGIHGLVIYSTYYPAAVVAMLAGGRRAGILATALGGLAAYYFFMPLIRESVALTLSDVINLALYFGSCGLIVLVLDRYQRAVSVLREEDARHLTLAREERHRLQNAISVAEAIVLQSLSDEPERARVINQRLRASQQEIHERDDGQPITLRDLLVAELRAYDLARFDLDLEDERELSNKPVVIVSLAVHELTTNALKYGALSTPNGRVSVASRSVDGRLRLTWREAGGPLVEPPTRRGFGTTLLRRLVEGAGGTLAIDYPPDGVTAEIFLGL